MSMTGFEDINQKFKAAMSELRVSRTQKTVESILIAVKFAAAPMVPVDTSNLINSAYSKTWRTTSGWMGEFGYGAEYAAAVHNMPGTLKGLPRASFGKTGNNSDAGPMKPTAFGGGTGTGTYWSPDAEPRFLEKAVKDVLAYDIDRIIKEQYTI